MLLLKKLIDGIAKKINTAVIMTASHGMEHEKNQYNLSEDGIGTQSTCTKPDILGRFTWSMFYTTPR